MENLYSNMMTELPPWLSLCEDLKDLELSWNKITTFPPWMPLRSMVRLSLHHNKISELPELESTITETQNSLTEMHSHFPPKVNDQRNSEDVPPPPPPRVPNMLPSRGVRSIVPRERVTNRNIPVSISPPLRSHLQNKRQVPPPVGPCLPSFPPPPIPPPPQFFENSDSSDRRISPTEYPSSECNPSEAPPIPPMPPHLRSRCLSASSLSQVHNLNDNSPVLNKDSASEDEGLYEECGKGSNEYPLEELLLHHNRIKSLPEKFLQMLPNLRLVNVSNNQLMDIPRLSPPSPIKKPADITESPMFTFNPSSENTRPMLENVEEFYCGCNGLSDLRALERCSKLKVLHAPYNELSLVPDRLIASLPKLEELVVAGNYLHNLPMGIASLQQLRLLRVNCNPLQILPPLSTLPHIKVVDASHCQLGEVRLETIIAPSLMILDVSENPSMSVDPQQVNLCSTRKSVSVVDASKDRFSDAPDVDALHDCCSTPRTPTSRSVETRLNSSSAGSRVELSHGKTSTRDHASGPDANVHSVIRHNAWRVGFAECIGREDRQKSLQLRVGDLNGDGRSGLFGLVEEAATSSSCCSKQEFPKTPPRQDPTSFTLTNCPISSQGLVSGQRASDVQKPSGRDETQTPASVGVMLSEVPRIFQEDLRTEDEEPLKCSMLSVLQRQQLRGHLLPYGFSVVHLMRRGLAQQRKSHDVAGVPSSAPTQPVRIAVSSYGRATAMIASSHRTEMLTPLPDFDEAHEVCSVGGSQCCHVTAECPEAPKTKIRPPSTSTCDLSAGHLAIVIASSALWKVMQASEVNQVCVRTPDPSLAARRLLTLAQAYGASKSISVMVVSLLEPYKPNESSSPSMFAGNEISSIQQKTGISRRNENERVKVSQTLKKEKTNLKSKIRSEGWDENGKPMNQKQLPQSKQEGLVRNDVYDDRPELPARSKLRSGQNVKVHSKNEAPTQGEQKILKNTKIMDPKIKTFQEDHGQNELKEKLKHKPRHLEDSHKNSGMMSLPCLSTEVKNKSAKLKDGDGNLPLHLDRSSPSGQSFSDLSLIAADEEVEVRGSRAPVWPGQLGPVAPSGPFAIDLNRCEEKLDDERIENMSDIIPQFQSRNSLDGTRFRRDRLSMRSSADSFVSNSSKTTRTGQDSVRSSQRSILKKTSVPVFRPFYHFPSPDSIIQLNKTHSGRYSPTLPHAFASRSHLSQSSDRSSLASKKLSIFSKVSPSSSRSLSALSGDLSDSDSSLSSIEKLGIPFHERESRQVSEEQLRSFEYMLEKNARTVYLRDLDSAREIAKLRHREKQLRQALSVPDLVVAQRRLERNLKEEKYNSACRKNRASENERHWWEVDDSNANYSGGKNCQESNNDHSEQGNYRRECNTVSSSVKMKLDENSASSKQMNSDMKASPRNGAATTPQLFQRGVVRKSRFGSGTARVLQNRLLNGTNKVNSPSGNLGESNMSERKEALPPFRRFGSLQNLKQYQKITSGPRNSCKVKQTPNFIRAQSFGSLQSVGSLPSMQPEVLQNTTAEMEERRSTDSVELESRMSNYWHANTTVF